MTGRPLHRRAAAEVEVPAGHAGGPPVHGGPLEQQHPGAGPGRLQGRAPAGDAEADDHHVVPLGALSQHRRREKDGITERGWFMPPYQLITRRARRSR